MQSLLTYRAFFFLFYFVYITVHGETEEEETSKIVSPERKQCLSTSTVLNQCPIWYFYNTSIGQCDCYNSIVHFNGPDNTYPNGIKCNGQKAFLAYNYYMTYSEERGLVLVTVSIVIPVDLRSLLLRLDLLSSLIISLSLMNIFVNQHTEEAYCAVNALMVLDLQ